MSNREQRIRDLAYNIWLEEGRPEGRDRAHWQMAERIVAAEDDKAVADYSAPESTK
jgi:hypothetical protein